MNRHDTDPLTLGLGVVFVVIGAGFLLGAVTGNDVDARWVVPIALLGVGLAGLVTSLIEIARRRDRRTDEPMDQPTADERTEARTATAESGWSANTPSTPHQSSHDDSAGDGEPPRM